jgi:hypothetical protein
MEFKAIRVGIVFFLAFELVHLCLCYSFSAFPGGKSPIQLFEIVSVIGPYLGTILAGGIAAYVSKHDKIATSVALGVLISICLGLITFTLPYTGLPADNIGGSGVVIVTLLSLPIILFLSAIGGVIGGWASKYKGDTSE